MKRCADILHEGTNPLPLSRFYFNARYSDGKLPCCKNCHKRRATADQKRRREARKALGLPASERVYKQLIILRRLSQVR